MNKYNELFKQLVSAGLVYHKTDKPNFKSNKRVKDNQFEINADGTETTKDSIL